MGEMASFLSRTPGATTGPAGRVHSVNLAEYGIWEGRLNDNDRANLLINMHDYFFPTKVNRNLAIKEIRNKRYFVDKGVNVAAPRHLFKHMRKEHAVSLCERGELGLGPLNYYTTIENENIADKHEGWVYYVCRRRSVLHRQR